MQNSPARSGIDVGTVIAETYTIEALVGRGGMGAVFMASHKRLPGKKVAIKFLHADLAGEEVLRRFEREAQIASKLGHPNIVGVTDYNVMADGTPYLVLEYLEGASLAQHLKGGPLPLERVMSIIRQVGSALAAAHREGIVHRDLKPQNIFLVPQEVENRVVDVAKVLDFGISKIRGSQTVKTQEAALLGTPQYMAPEQATGQHDKVDERTDVFALGAIVYEMLTGQPAFSGANIPEVVFKVVYEQPVDLATLAPSTPPAVLAAVKRAMEKKADDRFATVADFVEALTGQPLAVVRPSASIPPPDGGPSSGGARSSGVGGTGGGRSTGKEAFDATVGSGDHAQALAATSASAPPPAAAPARESVPVVPVRGSAPTVDSANVAGAAVANAAAAAPARGARGKKPFAFVWVVAGLVVVGGGAMFALSRGGGEKAATVAKAPPPEREAVPVEVATAEPTNAAPTNTGSTNVDMPKLAQEPTTPVGATKPGDAKKSDDMKKAADTKKVADAKKLPADTKAAETKAGDTKPADSKPVDAEETASGGEDATFADKLRDAQTALDGHDYAKAERLANAVINGDTSGPVQKAKAHVIHGIVACVAHNALGDANADARSLASYPKLQSRLTTRCHTAGIELTP
ncbi:MAG: protein kinase [Deltaproteobacteria bacterium]|nr:protein kinase [Deltaproteobacteria bacterium]